jgi:hypothetical protein
MRRAVIFAAFSAICAATVGGLAVAQQAGGGWSPSMRWPDGREVQWRATPAPACDGSNVELRFLNQSPSAGMAEISGATFSCVRKGEFNGPARSLGLVAIGGSAETTLTCMCPDKGGVLGVQKVDLEFMREGQGAQSDGGGCTYTGEYSQGKRTGRGVYACPTGYTHDGRWLNGEPHGPGKQTLPNGQIYEGEFDNGKRTGRGRMQYVDKSVYDGEFVDSARQGVGTMTFTDTSEYVGEWKANDRHGHGTYIAADKSWTYDGAWVNDVRQGQGKLTYTDGSYIYEGPFQNGLRSGEGVVTFADGSVFRGAFVNDQQVGQGELTYTDGRRVVGQFRDHAPHGKAIDTRGGMVFDGEWANGVLNGYATVIGADGLRFEGTFTRGLRNGLGRQQLADGSWNECTWVNDVVQGRCKKIKRNGATIEFR